jgi:hypothetical protein
MTAKLSPRLSSTPTTYSSLHRIATFIHDEYRIYVLDEVGGMMISLRPNSRASRDNAPGPRQMSDRAITADNAAVMWASTELTLEPGNQANTLLTPTNAARRATARVNSPIRSKSPSNITADTTTAVIKPGSCRSLK